MQCQVQLLTRHLRSEGHFSRSNRPVGDATVLTSNSILELPWGEPPFKKRERGRDDLETRGRREVWVCSSARVKTNRRREGPWTPTIARREAAVVMQRSPKQPRVFLNCFETDTAHSFRKKIQEWDKPIVPSSLEEVEYLQRQSCADKERFECAMKASSAKYADVVYVKDTI